VVWRANTTKRLQARCPISACDSNAWFQPKRISGRWRVDYRKTQPRPLAASGFAVLQIEDNHEQTESLEEARIHVNGYAAAIEKLAESGLIDPKRVGIIGFSRTCWFVEESLLELPDRFAAAVIAMAWIRAIFSTCCCTRVAGTGVSAYNGGKPIGKGLDSWISRLPDFRLVRAKNALRLQAITPASFCWVSGDLRITKNPA